MKKLTWKEIGVFILFICIISYLKSGTVLFVNYFENSTTKFLYTILAYLKDDPILRLIWITPILFSVFLACKNSYLYILNFSVRYKNRKTGYVKCMITHLLNISFFSIVALIIQAVWIGGSAEKQLIYDGETIKVILKYIIENITFSFTILTLSIYFKNFIYAFIANVIALLILMNISLINVIPVVSLFAGYEINLVSIMSIIICMILIFNFYLKLDFLGGKDR